MKRCLDLIDLVEGLNKVFCKSQYVLEHPLLFPLTQRMKLKI
jgi:hypothetical protein